MTAIRQRRFSRRKIRIMMEKDALRAGLLVYVGKESEPGEWIISAYGHLIRRTDGQRLGQQQQATPKSSQMK